MSRPLPAPPAPIKAWLSARDLLRPFARRMDWVRAPGVAPVSVGVAGLPDGAGELPVATPVALCWQQNEGAWAWLHELLGAQLARSPLLLVAHDEAWIDTLLAAPALAQAHAAGRLRLWLLTSPAVALPELLDELPRAGLGEGDALFIVTPRPLTLGGTVGQSLQLGRVLGRWCALRTAPVIFGHPVPRDLGPVLAPLHALQDTFEHIASLGTISDQPAWWVDRWNGRQGPLFQVRYGLQTTPAGTLAYSGVQAQGLDVKLVEAPDQLRLIATREALGNLQALPVEWEVVPSWEAAVAAAQDAVAATVLLHAGAASDFTELAYTVHALRRQHPRLLKILVRETRDKLRAHAELALGAAGANRVIYREIGLARLQRQVAELRNTVFPQDVPASAEEAIAPYQPEPVRGYLPPAAFCAQVQRTLERGTRTGLSHGLVRLLLQNRMAHLDALRATRAHRDGDIVTADERSIWVFLYGCAPTDLEATLARVFSMPLTELFATSVVDSSPDGMLALLQPLAQVARRAELPDHTLALQTLAPATTPAPALPSGSPSSPRPPLPRMAQDAPALPRPPRLRPAPIPDRRTTHPARAAAGLLPAPEGTRHAD